MTNTPKPTEPEEADEYTSPQVDPEAADLTWEDIVDIWFAIMPEHEEFRGGRL